MKLTGITLEPLSAKHYSYTNSTSSSSKISLTLSITGDYSETAISLAKFDSSGSSSFMRYYPSAASYTFSVSKFNKTNISNITVAISNTDIDGSSCSFNLSAKVS